MMTKPHNGSRTGSTQEYYARLIKRLKAEIHETNDDACVDAYWHAITVLSNNPPSKD